MAKPTGKAKRVIEQPIAYVIKDKAFGELEIKNSPNAWWLDKIKVEALLNVCKIDATVEECCYHTGISLAQYKYFIEQHPYFSAIKAQLNQYPFLKARKKIVEGIDESFENAMEYMKRKKKLEFSERQEIDNPAQTEAIKSLESIIKEIRK